MFQWEESYVLVWKEKKKILSILVFILILLRFSYVHRKDLIDWRAPKHRYSQMIAPNLMCEKCYHVWCGVLDQVSKKQWR